MKATRQSFGETLREIGSEFPNIVVLDADLSCSTKSELFAKAFPDRFFQMGIQEQNMIGVAAGMSFSGLIPFICSFGCFLAGRYETIRVSVGYTNANVKMVGTHSGVGIGEDGYSQMGLEDVSVLRGLPGMTILQPSDDITTKAAVRFAVKHTGPVYLRLTRQKLPALHKSENDFKCGKGILLREGTDLAILATGGTVTHAMIASEQLPEFNPWVVDIHTLKPIDRPLIESLAQTCKWIVTVEDHNVLGGLGSAVAEVMAEEGTNAKLIRLGIQDTFGESGKPKDLYEKFKLSGPQIAAQLKEILL